MKSLFSILAAALVVTGCGGAQQTAPSGLSAAPQPNAIPWPPGSDERQSIGMNGRAAGVRLMGHVKPDKGCPSLFIYCVTISRKNSATVYYCYSPGSYCGPSQYQYTWADAFYTFPGGSGVTYFSGFFDPNPGNPTYDRISLNVPLKSTHGKIKYTQEVCPESLSGCISGAQSYVGIRVK